MKLLISLIVGLLSGYFGAHAFENKVSPASPAKVSQEHQTVMASDGATCTNEALQSVEYRNRLAQAQLQLERAEMERKSLEMRRKSLELER